MAVKDLTPQLRTRLSRVERAVGWFVVLATLLLLGGFAYYVYHTAERKGWFKTKIPYFTYVRDATGLHIGDPVKMMGFDVGRIIDIEGTEAGKNWYTDFHYNVFVQFEIVEPYFGYIWSDSKVRIATGDFLGKRVLEVTKGTTGEPSVMPITTGIPIRVLHKDKTNDYVLLTAQPKGWWIRAEESPALTVRLEEIANRIELALPGIFNLTNQLGGIVSNTASLTANLNNMVVQASPVVTNLAVITSLLTNGNGSLGEWLIPTNLNAQLAQTLTSANATLATTDTNITRLAASLDQTLINLANITSNLNAQVQTNDQILSHISRTIVHADETMQGLKHHWLLRSAFKEKKTNAPRSSPRPAPPKAGK
jgi:ABC-type transporter Mla subunit MlaD